jgi:GTP pyrophosphokinase
MKLDYKSLTFEELSKLMDESGRNYDREKIEKAYKLAYKAHDGQLRSSGEPYICHPVTVAGLLVNLGMDTDAIVAAMLHDVVEDTDYELKDIEKEFGSDVAKLVDGVTKLSNLPYVSTEVAQAENLRKMLIAMNDDIRVIIIKLADRLHNMNTLQYLKEQKRRDKSLETLEVYAPIAHRLGIRALKDELEDLAIKHLDPVAYKDIEAALLAKKDERQKFLDDIKAKIKDRLSDQYPSAYVDGRVKSIHGIYRKMYMQDRSFDEIYDIYAVRIIVDTVADCYNILGIMHDMFSPIPGRFKDYISTPKSNNYQSLHTTVISRQKVAFEIQIRTWEMHRTAEYGIAAHWKYKLGIEKEKDTAMQQHLEWIKTMLENDKESGDVKEIVNTIKTDLASEDVFAVTPRGDVKSLPVDSTVIDFAYAIHSAVGNKMVGAKVNGRIVPIDYKIQTGDVIEILTTSNENHGPSRDWLKIVKTGQARSKIRSWFKKERRAENITEGKAELEKEFHRSNIRLQGDEQVEFLENIAKKNHCNSVEDFYATIGYGGINLPNIMPRIKEEYLKIERAKTPQDLLEIAPAEIIKTKVNNGIVVEGVDNCLTKISRCCNPIPGDEIVGYITRGHGVSIHERHCSNVPEDLENCEEPNRWLKAYWSDSRATTFKTSLKIVTINQRGMLADVSTLLSNLHVSIINMMARPIKNGMGEIVVTFNVENSEHLKTVISKIDALRGVESVERTNG